jgi:hypothetical protein
MKHAVYFDVMSCRSYTNRRFGETYRLHHQGDKNNELGAILRSVFRLLVSSKDFCCLPILVILITRAVRSSEMSILARPTGHNIPEDGIIHSHRFDSLKSYIFYYTLLVALEHKLIPQLLMSLKRDISVSAAFLHVQKTHN